MNNLIEYVKNLRKTQVGFMASALILTVTIFGSYKMIVSPLIQKQRRTKAEEYAEFLFANEDENVRTGDYYRMH